MKSRSLSACVIFLVLCCDAESMLFPLDRSVLGSPCKRKDGLNGLAKMFQRCVNNDPKEFLGVIVGRGSVLCCAESLKAPEIRIEISSNREIGNKSKAFCSDHSSSTLSPLVTKVIGGNFSDVGEFAHMAALGYENFELDLQFSCGGALISHRFVLTAAHCLIRDPKPKIVRLGRTDLNLNEKLLNIDGNPPVDIFVETTIVHPRYTIRKKYNDIGLVKLAEKVTFTDFVKPICLQVDSDVEELRREIILTGWGYIDKDRTQKSDWLMKALTKEIPLNVCRNNYASLGQLNLRKIMPQNVLKSQMCAQNDGIDTCQGDSGSPIQIISSDISERYYAIGIVSFGLGCASNIPAIYTRVSQYIEWIEETVWPGDSYL